MARCLEQLLFLFLLNLAGGRYLEKGETEVFVVPCVVTSGPIGGRHNERQ